VPSAAFYVDGFNLYHSLKTTRKTEHLLWLDLHALCKALIAPGEDLTLVKYFTALTHWNPDKVRRHQTFLTALENTGVTVVYGRFSPTTRVCGLCGKQYPTNEEKETDVNIASGIIRDGLEGAYDVAYLMTGDSDQAPTIKALRALSPGKKVVAVFSVNRHSAHLKNLADRAIQLTWRHFARNQFPNPVVLRSGKELHCPPSWLPPLSGAPSP
jgi:uncharacterized LabA/DUF88 family protein